MDSDQHRPYSVTILIWLVLIIAVGNLIKVAQTVQKWNFLDQLLQISPLYFLFTGLFWGIMGMALAWGLWKREWWSILALKWVALAFSFHYWFDRLVLVESETGNTNILFAAIVFLVFLVWLFWISSRNEVKTYFGV